MYCGNHFHWSLRLVSSTRTFAPLLLCSYLFVLYGPPCLGQYAPADAATLEELTSAAETAQQRGDYAAAAKAYQALVERRPDMAELWANLGLMHEFIGNYVEADHELQVALRKDPKLYVPNLFLGLNRLRAHEPGAALHYLKPAVMLNPHDEQAVLGLARAYSGIHDDDNAALWFDKARQLSPQDAEAWYGLGLSFLRVQDTAVLKLKKLGPDQVYARALVAESFLQQGRTKDAVRIYERFRSESAPPCLLSALGFAYAQVGAADKAKQSFLAEIEAHPECLLARIGFAQVAFVNGQVPQALEQLHFVMEKDPNFLDHNLQRVWTGLDQDQIKRLISEVQKDSGIEDALTSRLRQSVEPTYSSGASSHTAQNPTPLVQGRAFSLNPEKLWAEGRYGACASQFAHERRPASAARLRLLEACSFYAGQYRRTLETSDYILHTGEDADALYWKAKAAQELGADAFAQMNAIAPDSPKAHLLMAELHRARQEFPAAESEYNRVLASNGDDLSARLGLAHVYFQNAEDDKAAEQARDVLKADSSNVDAHSLLGQILVRRHQYDDAVPHLKIGLQGSQTEAPDIHSSLAQCYSARGEYSLALRELKQALPADTTGAFHYQAYRLYQRMGDQQSAAVALRESEEIRRRESDAEQQRTLTTGP